MLLSVSRVAGHFLYCKYSFPELAAQVLINIYIILAQGCIMSIFPSSDLKKKYLNEFACVVPIIC